MSETKDDKTISVSSKKTLTLKRSGVEQGTVRQDMGRGRTKAPPGGRQQQRIDRGLLRRGTFRPEELDRKPPSGEQILGDPAVLVRHGRRVLGR